MGSASCAADETGESMCPDSKSNVKSIGQERMPRGKQEGDYGRWNAKGERDGNTRLSGPSRHESELAETHREIERE